jgi:site-specific recombinase XerD
MRALGPNRAHGERDGLTKRQAEDRLRELIATTQTGSHNGRGAVTVKRVHEAYAAERGRRLKSTTLTDYAAIERNHLTPVFGDRPVDSLMAADVDAFVDRLIGRGLAATSIDNYVVYLSSLFNYAVDREWIAKNRRAA